MIGLRREVLKSNRQSLSLCTDIPDMRLHHPSMGHNERALNSVIDFNRRGFDLL